MLPSDWSNFVLLPNKCIHFIGIGGIGMSTLAKMCLSRGWGVQGSNAGESNITRELRETGALIFPHHNKSHLESGANLVVISSAIGPDNPELQQALALGIPVCHRSQFLKNLIVDYHPIAVSGTHGKTTTTSLLGHVLAHGGADPLVISGGIMGGWNSTLYQGKGPWAIVEADESDKSHLNFHGLEGAIVTNIEPEHMANYRDFQDLLGSFLTFLNLASRFAIVCGDDPGVQYIMPHILSSRVISYGQTENCHIQAHRIRCEKTGMIFDIKGELGNWKDVQVCLWGEHNVLNTLAVIIAASQLGLTENAIRSALACFSGVDRRMTFKGKVARTTIIDDYAHHATEIKAVLKTLKMMGYKKILALCQPHRYTRLRETMELFMESFRDAHHVILFPVYGAGETPIPEIESPFLAEQLVQRGQSAQACEPWPQSRPFITSILAHEDYDVAICMGAGTITDIAHHIASGSSIKEASLVQNPSLSSTVLYRGPSSSSL